MTYPVRVHEAATKGQRIFRQLSEKLEKEHLGEAVAIEVDTGDYFLGKTGLEAVRKAREQYPGKLFFVGRVGQPAYVSFRPRRTRQWREWRMEDGEGRMVRGRGALRQALRQAQEGPQDRQGSRGAEVIQSHEELDVYQMAC